MGETWFPPCPYQLLARRLGAWRATRTRASTATVRSGSASTGFRSSSATSGSSSASRERRSIRSTRASPSAGGAPRKPGDEPARLARVDELVRVDVGERRQAELRRADQLGEHAAGAERDERAEHRVLDGAGEQLRAAAHHRLDEQRCADPLCGRAHLRLVGEIERDPAGLRLVRAGGRALHDDREAQLLRGGDGVVDRVDDALRHERQPVRLEEPPRRGGLEPRVVGALERLGDDRLGGLPVELEVRQRAGGPSQPVAAVGRPSERARCGFRVARTTAPARGCAATPVRPWRSGTCRGRASRRPLRRLR